MYCTVPLQPTICRCSDCVDVLGYPEVAGPQLEHHTFRAGGRCSAIQSTEDDLLLEGDATNDVDMQNNEHDSDNVSSEADDPDDGTYVNT